MHSNQVLKHSHCETAQFCARSMDIIQMVLTLIRPTRKTTLSCMPALSVCLVPNVHYKRSQQLRQKTQDIYKINAKIMQLCYKKFLNLCQT